MNEWDGKSSENSNYGSSLCLAFRTYKARTRSRRLLLLKTMNKSNYSWGNKSAALAASATCKRLLQVMAPTGMAWHAWQPLSRETQLLHSFFDPEGSIVTFSTQLRFKVSLCDISISISISIF
jgi:hypothetical protein